MADPPLGRRGPALGPYRYVVVSIYHTRGSTWLSQAPHTNESIVCRRPSSRTINVTYPATSFIRLTPSCQEHPADELHHSGKIMPRHTTGNPRHETADRRPVSSHRIVLHQSIEHGLCRKYHGILVCIVFSAEHCSCRK